MPNGKSTAFRLKAFIPYKLKKVLDIFRIKGYTKKIGFVGKPVER